MLRCAAYQLSAMSLSISVLTQLYKLDLVVLERFLKGINFRDTRLTHYLIFRNRPVHPMTDQI